MSLDVLSQLVFAEGVGEQEFDPFEPRLGCGLETIEKVQLTVEHSEVCGELRHGALTLIVRISAEEVREW